MRHLLLAALLSLPAAAPDDPSRVLVIRDATVVPSPGRSLPNARVLMRDGLIVDVGPDVPIPDGAEVVDGKGLFVYAGFIDARSTIGLADTKRSADELRRAEGEKPDVTREAPPRMEQANRKGVRPELDAGDRLHVTEEAAKKAHAGGFALAVAAVADEYLAGRAALVTLSAEPRRNALVRGRSALHASFKTYGDGYPGTTMGVVAQLRQTLMDAQHHGRLLAAWTPGTPRPPVDASLDALLRVMREKAPVVFEARTDREILRALSLAEEFDLDPTISGGDEAWRVADVLQERKIPVVLSLKLPKEPKREKDDEPEPEKLRAEKDRLRKEALRGAATLHAAGIVLAFSSAGLDSPADALPNVATIVDAGLPVDAALAALTTTPARLVGIDATHGTLEKGKTATLTVLTAPLGDRKARTRFIVADGRRFEYEPPKAEDEKKDDPKKDDPTVAAPPTWPVETDADRVPATKTGGHALIRNATILTVTKDGTIPRASILIRDGKIEAIGPDLQAPEGTTVIDAAGLHVMPGIVDCHSHIACEGGLNEFTQSITPEVRVRDVLDPRDIAIYRALAGGVTAANILHGSANAVGGQNAVIKLKWGVRPEGLLFSGAPQGVKFALGENPKQANFPASKGKRFPNTRLGVEAAFRRAFVEAREYGERRKADPLTRPDLRLDALLGIVNGDIHVHCHCYRADEILMILRVAQEHGFGVRTLQHVLEGYRVAPEIAAAGAGASTFSDWWVYKVEAFEAIPHNAALLTRAGVVTSLNSDSPEQIRHLALEAAKSMKHGGLTEHEALALVTLNPAVQLGIASRVGTVAPGKDADLAFFDGHPLSAYSRCVLTMVDGKVEFEAPRAPPRGGTSPASRPRRLPGPLPKGATVALVGGELHPPDGPAFLGTLVMRGGKIESMGPDVRTPSDAEVVDAAGLHVYPGLIDAATTLGLTEVGSVSGMRDDAEIGAFQPDLRALASVNPHSELIPVTRANGITAALTRPLGVPVAGQSALIRLDGWTPDELAVRDPVALHIVWPEPPSADADKPEHEKRLKALRERFAAAKRYTAGGHDLAMEAMQPYLKGERPVVFEAQRARDIRAALRFAEDFGLRPVISGGREAWKLSGLLADKKVPVIVAGVLAVPDERTDPYDACFANPAALVKAGVKVAISSAEAFQGNSRNTPYHAAWASAYGLDRDEALRAVTIRPAEILGVADRTGSLAPGKDADLIVTTGDPLEVVTDVVWMFIAGRPVSLESKHTRLYEKFSRRPVRQK